MRRLHIDSRYVVVSLMGAHTRQTRVVESPWMQKQQCAPLLWRNSSPSRDN
jgi:hypothetical protein